MKTIKRLLLTVLAVAIVVLAVSCLGSVRLIGEWVNQSAFLGVVTESGYTFNIDGKGSVRTVLGIELPFKYKAVGNRLTVDLVIPEGAQEAARALGIAEKILGSTITLEYTYSIEGDTLSIADKDGKITSYERQR